MEGNWSGKCGGEDWIYDFVPLWYFPSGGTQLNIRLSAKMKNPFAMKSSIPLALTESLIGTIVVPESKLKKKYFYIFAFITLAIELSPKAWRIK